MINLMYLVLTALLALNVSAEVMNAFFSLDRGLANSRGIVEKNNDALRASIDKAAHDYPSPAANDYNNRAGEANKVAAEFVEYIEGIRKNLFEKAGGENPKVPGQPKDIRNKDLTTKMFVNDGLGAEIEQKIKETREKLVALVDKDVATISALPLDVDPLPENTKAKSWSEFKFKQMPVAAVFPLLGKMQSDAKSSATAVLNYCATKVQGTDIKFDKFQPGISAKKSYIIAGEDYEADVFLSAFSSKLDNININVDGRSLPLKDGIGTYKVNASTIGTKKYTVTINLKNPATGVTETVKKEFEYEVGQRSVAVALEKMNVFYIGVDNPVAVSAAGISSNDLKVSASGVSISKTGGSNYIVKATTPGEATITVSGPGVTQTFKYRVKRIPDPSPQLGARHKSKQMANGEFKAQGGIAAVLENFDFEAKCDVVGFKVGYLKKRQDPVEKTNSGARWGSDVADIINKAAPGDTYFFDEIKARCPGDAASRELGSLVFKIK